MSLSLFSSPLHPLPCLPSLQAGMAQMLKGGVIMDVVNPEQARIAEEAGESREPGEGGRGRGGMS
eukprot:scaffold118740_cov30-Tisochrysis_lutea.AAC.1